MSNMWIDLAAVTEAQDERLVQRGGARDQPRKRRRFEDSADWAAAMAPSCRRQGPLTHRDEVEHRMRGQTLCLEATIRTLKS
jgi:hypothetical protein